MTYFSPASGGVLFPWQQANIKENFFPVWHSFNDLCFTCMASKTTSLHSTGKNTHPCQLWWELDNSFSQTTCP